MERLKNRISDEMCGNIAYYDRVLVMDAGEIAEFDTVLNLFDKEDSIFRSLCNEAGLSRQDILRIRQQSQPEIDIATGQSST
jgi:ATP-binding cassette, subfamily C (CFTR/MRP), member 1